MGLEILRETSLNAHIKSLKKRKKENTVDTMSMVSRAPSLTTVIDYIEEHKEKLQRVNEFDFDTLKFCKELGRKSALSVMTIHVLQQLHIDQLPNMNQLKLSRFLGRIYKGYRRDVEYHNDMHAVDVLQMSYLFLTRGRIVAFAQLSELDALSVCISAICHDFDHDGFNNAYHVNKISDRAIRYSDQSVQEHYHAAESFALLSKDEIQAWKE